MRRIAALLLLICLTSSLFAAVEISSDLYDDFFDGKYQYTEPTVSLGPYNSASGIKMNSQNYPSRIEIKGALNWKGHNFPGESILNTDYYDDNIIAIGAVYDIPSAYGYSSPESTYTEWENYLGVGRKRTETQTMKVAVLVDVPTIEVSTNSSSDFMFVSQSKPSYRRPFELALQPKMSVSSAPESHSYPQYPNSGGYIGNVKNFGDNMENIIPLDHPDTSVRNSSNFYSTFWFDLLLALPYDEGSYAEDGIIDDKIKYELIETDDYSSVVAISISYLPRYEIYELTRKRDQTEGALGGGHVDWEWKDYTFTPTEEIIVLSSIGDTISLPFSGYYSRIDLPEVESSASFYVYPYPVTARLNLDPATELNPRSFIDIADINLVYNFDETWVSEGEIDGLTCSANNNSNNARIFLSANRDSKSPNENGFMFIHQGASNIIEGVNAVRYTVRVRDNDTGLYTSYDGREYVDGTTYQMVGNDKFLYSKHHYSNPFWHTFDNNSSSQNYQKVRLSHFHTFEGVVSILIDDTSLNMEPGVYESTIYVHLIAP